MRYGHIGRKDGYRNLTRAWKGRMIPSGGYDVLLPGGSYVSRRRMERLMRTSPVSMTRDACFSCL